MIQKKFFDRLDSFEYSLDLRLDCEDYIRVLGSMQHVVLCYLLLAFFLEKVIHVWDNAVWNYEFKPDLKK